MYLYPDNALQKDWIYHNASLHAPRKSPLLSGLQATDPYLIGGLEQRCKQHSYLACQLLQPE